MDNNRRQGVSGNIMAITKATNSAAIDSASLQPMNLRDKRREEMKLSQNMVEEKKDTKTNRMYNRLATDLKELKNGYTVMNSEEEESN